MEQIKKLLKDENILLTSVDLQDSTYYADIEFCSDAGEDVIETILFDGTPKDFITQFKILADNFDAEEHAERYINMRGTYGVPDSIRTLIDDADDIKETLLNTAHYLEENYAEEE